MQSNVCRTPIQPDQEGFIGKEAVGRRIGKSVRTVDNWMREGHIPFYKIGRSVCFKWSEIEDYLRRRFHVCGGDEKGGDAHGK